MNQEIQVGEFFLKNENGNASLRLRGLDGSILVWDTTHSKSAFTNPAEELAKALALIDGRFEVRRFP
jgi:hypothetical protein